DQSAGAAARPLSNAGRCSAPSPLSAASRRSRSGRSERMRGSEAKLYGGGGEVVSHSSVLASHGSLPARMPRRQDTTAFQAKISMEKPSRNAPTVSKTLIGRKPVSTG